MKDISPDNKTSKPLITIVVPCFNEEAILGANLEIIRSFLISRSKKYQWEILIITVGRKINTRE